MAVDPDDARRSRHYVTALWVYRAGAAVVLGAVLLGGSRRGLSTALWVLFACMGLTIVALLALARFRPTQESLRALQFDFFWFRRPAGPEPRRPAPPAVDRRD